MGGNRRDFILGVGALGLMVPLGGCRLFGGGPDSVRGAVLHVKDLTPESGWPRRAAEAGLNTIATHVFPEDVIPFLKSENGRRFTDECRRYGLAVEHEMHAIEYLLPRDLFDRNPELFRLDEKGVRQRKSNGCFTNPRTLEIIAERAVELSRLCPPTTGRYFYWLSDFGPTCRCERCRRYTPAEQGVIVENAIVSAIRREIDPHATLSHLAYAQLMTVPEKVKPHEGLFLEFAPVNRWRRNANIYKREDLPEGCDHLARLDALLKLFPADTAQVLEYWLDESLYCYYKKPLKKLPWDAERTHADVAAYRRRGIRRFTNFAVWLNAEYEKTHGCGSLACVKEYGDILKEQGL